MLNPNLAFTVECNSWSKWSVSNLCREFPETMVLASHLPPAHYGTRLPCSPLEHWQLQSPLCSEVTDSFHFTTILRQASRGRIISLSFIKIFIGKTIAFRCLPQEHSDFGHIVYRRMPSCSLYANQTVSSLLFNPPEYASVQFH